MSTFQKVANDWTALTDAEKITLFKAADDTNPAISDLSALGKFRIATYAEDNTQPKCTVTAVPKDQIVLPKELISIHSFENIDSITLTETDDINPLALLHFDESTTKDECGNVWTLSGTPTIDSNQRKFGGKSLYLNGSSYLTTPSVCNFGTGDFTVDFWAYTPAYNASIPYAVITNSNGGLGISLYNNNLNLARATIANDISTPTISTISSQWNHYAVTRKNGVAYLFVNGALMKSGEWTVNCVSTNTYIGVDGDATNAKVTGYIDEFRISNIARWTADFTPPTSPYTVDNKYIKYAFTTDLTNYKVYNTTTSTWDIIQSDNILTNGMTATQIKNLTSAQIMQLFGSASGLGIAMGIPSSKVVSVDNLAMQVDMKGAWNHAVYGTDVTYGYTNNNVLSVKLLTNGDYKINYNNLGTS